MTLAEIVARTEAHRAAGTLPTFEGSVAPAKEPMARVRARTKTCGELGPELKRSCGATLHRCARFGDLASKGGRCLDAQRACMDCDYHTALLSLGSPQRSAAKVDRFGPVGKRHLVYHLLPVGGNGIWRRGVDALRLRWSMFTGRKVVAVATGGPIREQVDAQEGIAAPSRTLPLDPVAAVRAYLPDDAEVIEVPNDPAQWERVSWAKLWARVLDGADDLDAVLYAHAKGVTRRPGSPCHRWADLLYALNLDHWPEVEAVLRHHPIAGSLVKRGKFFGPPSDASDWHYSGNFWWLRAGDARKAVASVPVPSDRWGAEAWPGIAFPLAEAGEVFGPGGSDFHLYDPAHLDRVLASHAQWLATHAPTASAVASPARPPSGVRLSVIVPTTGRPALARALESITSQLLPGDEVIVRADRSGDWGATPRTEGMRQATGDYLLWMDDDDIYTPGALAAIRAALKENPGRPHLFRMRRAGGINDALPRVRAVRVGEVSTQMFCAPNDPAKLGAWGKRYEGDFDFISSTLAHYPPDAMVWRQEVIAVWRPGAAT